MTEEETERAALRRLRDELEADEAALRSDVQAIAGTHDVAVLQALTVRLRLHHARLDTYHSALEAFHSRFGPLGHEKRA